MTRFEIQNTVALVTGTNKPRGIGRAIVEELLAAGAAKVYATARSKAQLQDLVDRHGDRVVAIELDVTDPASIRAAVVAAPDVALLVNNSGLAVMADGLGDVDSFAELLEHVEETA